MNWAINIGILALIIASYVANREAAYHVERALTGLLVVVMALTVVQGCPEAAADAGSLRRERSAEASEVTSGRKLAPVRRHSTVVVLAVLAAMGSRADAAEAATGAGDARGDSGSDFAGPSSGSSARSAFVRTAGPSTPGCSTIRR